MQSVFRIAGSSRTTIHIAGIKIVPRGKIPSSQSVSILAFSLSPPLSLSLMWLCLLIGIVSGTLNPNIGQTFLANNGVKKFNLDSGLSRSPLLQRTSPRSLTCCCDDFKCLSKNNQTQLDSSCGIFVITCRIYMNYASNENETMLANILGLKVFPGISPGLPKWKLIANRILLSVLLSGGNGTSQDKGNTSD
jgi:hypothetical protein